jgi:hypothetical protein
MRVKEMIAEIRREERRRFAASGGRGRARKYSHAQLSRWSQKGGRPRGWRKAKKRK